MKTNMKMCAFKMPESLIAEIERIAAKKHISKSALMREAISDYLVKQKDYRQRSITKTTTPEPEL
jgi:predicted transcriptional regulator